MSETPCGICNSYPCKCDPFDYYDDTPEDLRPQCDICGNRDAILNIDSLCPICEEQEKSLCDTCKMEREECLSFKWFSRGDTNYHVAFCVGYEKKDENLPEKEDQKIEDKMPSLKQ